MTAEKKAEKKPARVEVTLMVNTVEAKAFDVVSCDPETAARLVESRQGYIAVQSDD